MEELTSTVFGLIPEPCPISILLSGNSTGLWKELSACSLGYRFQRCRAHDVTQHLLRIKADALLEDREDDPQQLTRNLPFMSDTSLWFEFY